MNLKLITSVYIILNCGVIIKTKIVLNNSSINILQCTAKIYNTLTESKVLLISKINENLIDFNSMRNSQGLVIYTKDFVNSIKFEPFNIFIIYIQSIKQYEELILNLYKTNFWNSRGKFIVGYFGNADIGTIFNISWNYLIYNIDVVSQINQETNVYTFYPYQNKICGKYYNYNILASCEEEIKDFFPNKIPLQLPSCEIKVMAMAIPPYVIDITKAREESRETGLEVTIIHNVVRRINSSLKIIPNPHKHWGYRYKDGNVTMMFKSLRDREVEIIFGYMYANNSYTKDFEPSLSYLNEASIWFFPTASQLPQWKNMTAIFEPELWLAIFIMLFINGISWYFIGRSQETTDDFKDIVMCILNSMYILLQGSIASPSTWKIRIIFLLWSIACLLIFTAHQSQLISVLTTTLYERQMKTMEEFLQSKNDFGFYPVGEEIFQEKTPLNIEILRRYTPCPLTAECVNRTAFQRDFAVIKNRRQVMYLMPRIYTFPNGRPMLYDTDIVCLETKQMYYMNKGYPLLDRINNLLMLMQANGLIQKWDADTRFYVLKLTSDREAEPLSLQHLQGAFFVLISGQFFSVVVYVCEVVYKKVGGYIMKKS